MKIHNCLPTLIDCLTRWKTFPDQRTFRTEYTDVLRPVVGDFFDDVHGELHELDWNAYREKILRMDAKKEENRLRHNLSLVENLFQFKLEGEILLLGTFEGIDGFARFDRGRHLVYLGVDENFDNGKYIDVLTVHELTHVARESRPEVWQGFGLDPKMSRSEFLNSQPVIEHLIGEGFSCLVSEILVPGEKSWNYAYQNEKTLSLIYANAKKIGEIVKNEIRHPDGDYGRLYGIRPNFAHYVWAWQWTKRVLQDFADHDPKKLVTLCSKEFVNHALQFELGTP